MNWVNDVNNRGHDERTKWWPIHQFTFIGLIAKMNAVNSRSLVRTVLAEPLLKLWRALAKDMLENELDDQRRVTGMPTFCKLCLGML